MRIMDRELKPWLHGVVSVLLGFILLWTMTAFPVMNYRFLDIVNNLLYYPEKPFMQLRSLIKYSSNWVLERSSLQERVSQLELKNRVMSEALQKAGIIMPAPKDSTVAAQVTLRYPEAWWQEMRIDKGRRDGIAEGAAVMSEGFLIGRISRLGDNYAWVELITSSSFFIAAAVDETRDLGVINGDDHGNLKLLYIPEERKLKRGMSVSTSLMSELVPPGIPIGSIIGPEEPKEGFMPMKIQAGAHLTQLYAVEVFSAARVAK